MIVMGGESPAVFQTNFKREFMVLKEKFFMKKYLYYNWLWLQVLPLGV